MSSASSNRSTRRLGNAGISTMEMAVVALLFVWLTMAITDIARYLFTRQAMLTVATDVERYAMLQRNATVPGALGQMAAYGTDNTLVFFPTLCPYSFAGIAASAPFLDPQKVQVCVADLNSAGIAQVQVTVQYPFQAITPGLSMLTTSMQNPLQEQLTFAY